MPELPTTLSPSKVSSFTDCALAFRFSAIDRIPQPPTVATVRGTLVHSALEGLIGLDPRDRTRDAALECLERAVAVLDEDPEWSELALDEASTEKFLAESTALVHRYFELEDPTTVDAVGLELPVAHRLFADDPDRPVVLRGIIDRLERDAQGRLVVTDYKTGRAPAEGYQQSRMTGVHIYAYLCERVHGERPSKVRLLFLGSPAVVEAEPTDQSTRQIERKLTSIWNAIETACARDDFRPKQSRLCSWCAYQQWCPAFGGDPEEARRLHAGSAPPPRRDVFERD
ncbi:MAG: PD-(D/E)XK nuclease family protein [Acidimicrobiia bacterium]|nr:PD-(D/E)XK nuclease family protein [Acidimicrobiia bacterium]